MVNVRDPLREFNLSTLWWICCTFPSFFFPFSPFGDSAAVNGYIEAVRGLACDILDLMAEGLRAPDTSVFSRLVRAADSDSVFRINHYPRSGTVVHGEVGFGEHSDPQILTVLRSTNVGGLQISLEDGVWTPVPPDPTAFWINVGDVLQVSPYLSFLISSYESLIQGIKEFVDK